jgi:hypothetical protein
MMAEDHGKNKQMRDTKTKLAVFVIYNFFYMLAGIYLLIISELYLAWFLIPKQGLFIIMLIEAAGILRVGLYINKAYSKKNKLGTDGQFQFAKWALWISGIITLFCGSSPFWY